MTRYLVTSDASYLQYIPVGPGVNSLSSVGNKPHHALSDYARAPVCISVKQTHGCHSTFVCLCRTISRPTKIFDSLVVTAAPR
jgi:hypothetical protein